MKIIKRNGAEEVFHLEKIIAAIHKANDSVEESCRLTDEEISDLSDVVQRQCEDMGRAPSVEEIQDLVENQLMKYCAYELARSYITYRYKRALVRKSNSTDDQILSLLEFNNEEVKQENSNKNPIVNSVQRDYMAGEVSKDITRRFLLPPDIAEAHQKGLIHFHDADYFAQHMHNCCLVNLDDMLQNGTIISETMIDKPKSFSTACNIATQAIAQIASSQYGGQSISLAHLAPFVDISRQKFRKTVRAEFESQDIPVTDEQVNNIAEIRLREEINRGVQMIQYQVITLMTTNGQAPFVTVFMYLHEAPEGQVRDDLALIIEEMLNQRIKGVKNEAGVFITPAFPKLIYVLEDDNITEDSKYWALTRLAAKCTAKRMVPDYISEKVMKELKGGDVYACMGCRSFLTPDRFTDAGLGNVAKAKNYKEGVHKYYGRFNQGVVTINLVDVACSSYGNEKEFWRILDERLELCHRALLCRHERLKGTLSDVAPILWQNGALARLEKGETIDKLLFDGYSTISLGYAGLCECVKRMKDCSHTTPEGCAFATKVMQRLNDACLQWKKESNIDFSVYGTPLESTTYKFAKCLQKRFGIIPGVTDKNYITNSYHVHVTEEIDAFEKLRFEAQFQKLSPGGAISYVEVPNMQNNLDAVLSIMQFIYDNIMYAELNTKSDFCQVCGFDGEIKIVNDEDGKLIWECPNCGNRDQNKMNVARRTCGYIGTQFWNQGRTQEIRERVLHVSTDLKTPVGCDC
ncbi:MAG: anaerobic ribonucleoside-triphosphate reductase [Lachnospiraceae bacterium]|nr:anaerobic ribonucleoside-triphosphate reductase [Lachnospiraceae bacterium]